MFFKRATWVKKRHKAWLFYCLKRIQSSYLFLSLYPVSSPPNLRFPALHLAVFVALQPHKDSQVLKVTRFAFYPTNTGFVLTDPVVFVWRIICIIRIIIYLFVTLCRNHHYKYDKCITYYKNYVCIL